MVEVVLVRVCRVLGAGLERCTISSIHHRTRGRKRVLTCRVAAVGPFFSPFITTFQISSYGGSSSQGMDIRGESHLTIDEGSSNRIRRLSKLTSGPVSQPNIVNIRSGLVRALPSLVMPFPTFLWRGNYMDLSSALPYFTQRSSEAGPTVQTLA